MDEQIICLGWGSLIWDAGDLDIPEEKWHSDGPYLPLEFVRFSRDGRVTLVVDPPSTQVRVLWGAMHQTNLDSAIEALRVREGKPARDKIHYMRKSDPVGEDAVRKNIRDWMLAKGFSTVIWTGLSYRDDIRPAIEDVIAHIKAIQDPEVLLKTEEYFRKAPAQIDTAYRRMVANEFGWSSSGSLEGKARVSFRS